MNVGMQVSQQTTSLADIQTHFSGKGDANKELVYDPASQRVYATAKLGRMTTFLASVGNKSAKVELQQRHEGRQAFVKFTTELLRAQVVPGKALTLFNHINSATADRGISLKTDGLTVANLGVLSDAIRAGAEQSAKSELAAQVRGPVRNTLPDALPSFRERVVARFVEQNFDNPTALTSSGLRKGIEAATAEVTAADIRAEALAAAKALPGSAPGFGARVLDRAKELGLDLRTQSGDLTPEESATLDKAAHQVSQNDVIMQRGAPGMPVLQRAKLIAEFIDREPAHSPARQVFDKNNNPCREGMQLHLDYEKAQQELDALIDSDVPLGKAELDEARDKLIDGLVAKYLSDGASHFITGGAGALSLPLTTAYRLRDAVPRDYVALLAQFGVIRDAQLNEYGNREDAVGRLGNLLMGVESQLGAPARLAERIETNVASAASLRTTIAAGGKTPTPAQANSLLLQVTMAREDLNRLFPKDAERGDGDLGNQTGRLDLRQLPPQQRAQAMKLTDLISANLRILNKAADTTPTSAGYQRTAPARLIEQGADLRAARKAFNQHVDGLIPEQLRGNQGNPPLSGKPAADATNLMVWRFKDMLRNSPDAAILISANQAFGAMTSREDWVSALVNELALDPNDPAVAKAKSELSQALDAGVPSQRNVQIGRKLGEGTFGAVHLATFNGEEVVVKIPKRQDPNLYAGLVELATQGRLHDDPNIPRVVGVFKDAKGVTCTIMEVVNGDNHDEFFQKNADLPPAARTAISLHLYAGTAGALDTMHRRGEVHLDIKPANTMADGNTFESRLIDYGLSQAVGTRAVGAGSPYYMAPEVYQLYAAAKRGDKAFLANSSATFHPGSDIWSLGVSLLDNLGINCNISLGTAAYWQDVSAQPNWQQQPREVQDLIRACLHPDPEARPTAAQMAQARAGEEVTPARVDDGLGYRLDSGLAEGEVSVLDVLRPGGLVSQGRENLATLMSPAAATPAAAPANAAGAAVDEGGRAEGVVASSSSGLPPSSSGSSSSSGLPPSSSESSSSSGLPPPSSGSSSGPPPAASSSSAPAADLGEVDQRAVAAKPAKPPRLNRPPVNTPAATPAAAPANAARAADQEQVALNVATLDSLLTKARADLDAGATDRRGLSALRQEIVKATAVVVNDAQAAGRPLVQRSAEIRTELDDRIALLLARLYPMAQAPAADEGWGTESDVASSSSGLPPQSSGSSSVPPPSSSSR